MQQIKISGEKISIRIALAIATSSNGMKVDAYQREWHCEEEEEEEEKETKYNNSRTAVAMQSRLNQDNIRACRTCNISTNI